MPPDPPSVHELDAAIARYGATTLYLTSAFLNLMVDERVEAFARVKHLLVGGDAISVPHARRVLAANPGLTLINGYGPTETTTFASCGIMTAPGCTRRRVAAPASPSWSPLPLHRNHAVSA